MFLKLFRRIHIIVPLVLIGFLLVPLKGLCAEAIHCLESECELEIQRKNDDSQHNSQNTQKHEHCPLLSSEDSCVKSGDLCCKFGKYRSDSYLAQLKELSSVQFIKQIDSSNFFRILEASLDYHHPKNRIGRGSTFLEIDQSHIKFISLTLTKSSFLC